MFVHSCLYYYYIFCLTVLYYIFASVIVNKFQILELFKKDNTLPKFDSRITGSETVDTFLNEILIIIINDYVTPWYELITNDEEFTSHAIKRLVLAGGANVSNR